MIIQTKPKSAHWYGWSEEKQCAYPVYEVPYAEKNRGMRPTNLGDARKLGLMKSVTTVCGLLHKDGLERWKDEQLVLSSLTLPRPMEPADQWWVRCITELGVKAHDAEQAFYWCVNNPRRPAQADDEWAHKIIKDAEAQSEKARDIGTEIHEWIETLLDSGRIYDLYAARPEMVKILGPISEWIQTNVQKIWASEGIVCSRELGVAGKMDLKADLRGHGPTCYVDFKGQDVKNGKPKFYDEWLYQLAGYRMCDAEPGTGEDMGHLVSVVIDRATGQVHEKTWTNEESAIGQEAFVLLNRLWEISNGYEYEPTTNELLK